MGSVGTASAKPFSYDEYAKEHTKTQIAGEFISRTGINIDLHVQQNLSKSALTQMCQQVEDMSKTFEKDWGFRPISDIGATDARAFAQAAWYGDPKHFKLQVNATQWNVAADKRVEYIKESVAHEFGHLVVSNYTFHVAKDADDRNRMLYDSNGHRTDPSPFGKYYRGWNTKFAKDVLKRALANNAGYQEHYEYSWETKTAKREQDAINDTVFGVSKYASASYHEAIAESFSREYSGHGNEVSNAIVNEMKRMYKERKLIK